MTTWLVVRGARWCPVTSFIGPGDLWDSEEPASVASVIAFRFRRPVELGTPLALELNGGAIIDLRVCLLRQASVADGAWELVAELSPRAAASPAVERDDVSARR